MVLRWLNRFVSIAALWFLLAAGAHAALPPGFQEVDIARPDGQVQWNGIVGVRFMDSGRAFAWERDGYVWIVDPANPVAEPFLDIHDEINADHDHGMLGFALDPNYLNNGLFYVLYVVDHHHLTHCDSSQPGPAVCDEGYRTTTNEYARATIGRLTRYRAVKPAGHLDYSRASTVDYSSRRVLIGNTPALGKTTDPAAPDASYPYTPLSPMERWRSGCPITYLSHSVGSIVFGRDGTLLAACGDGASYSGEDPGSYASSYYVDALALGLMAPKENVGAFRAQMVDSLSGKIWRLDPATGAGVGNNPYYDPAAPYAPRSRVWSLGWRNPYRMTLRPGTGSLDPAAANPGVLYVGDVGYRVWEELDVNHSGGQNFGWPIYEGMNTNSAYASKTIQNQDAPNPLFGTAGCTTEPHIRFNKLLVQDTLATPSFPNPCNAGQQLPSTLDLFVHSRPLVDWRHGVDEARWPAFNGTVAEAPQIGQYNTEGSWVVSGMPFQGNTSTAGTWYSGAQFPPEYRNTYFHADFGAQWIRNFSFNDVNFPQSVRSFLDDAGGVVGMAENPADGSLYYISWATFLRRVTYVDDAAPTVPTGLFARALSTTQVTLTWSPSSDAGVGVAGYRIYRNGSALPIATVTGTAYLDYGLTPGELYSYTVSAFDNAIPANVSARSAAASVRTFAAPNDLPNAVFSVSTTTGRAPLTVNFDGAASQDPDGTVVEYQWSFGDGSTASGGPLASHAYSAAGTYSASLMVVDDDGGTGIATPITITVLPPPDSVAPTAPKGLVANPVGPRQINLTWSAASDAGGSGIAGYRVYRDGSSTPLATVTGTSYSDTSLALGTVYTYSVTAFDYGTPANESVPSNLSTATTFQLSLYQGQDIGAVAAAGSASATAGVFTVRGSGADIWGTADEFQFAWQPLSGNGEIIARVVSQTNTNAYAKAGVMLRETLNASARHASLLLTPANGSLFQYRTVAGGSSGPSGSGNLAHSAPYWVRLVRNGNVITGYTSPDGAAWTQRGTVSINNLAASVYIGLAVTSHSDGVLTTAVFDNLSPVGGSAESVAPSAPGNLAVTAAGMHELDVTWSPSSDDGIGVAGYRLYLDDALLASVPAGQSSFTVRGLQADTSYLIGVVAYDNAGNASTMSQASGTTTPTPVWPTFSSIQQNVFTPMCASCHFDNGAPPAGLMLESANSYAALMGVASSQVPGLRRVMPGNADASYLIHKLEGIAAVGNRMPDGASLPQSTIDAMRQWINAGATLDTTTAPVLAVIPPQTLVAGTSRTLTLHATDADPAQALVFGISPATPFVTLTDHGNRTATLTIAPTASDAGLRTVTVSVSDAGDPVQSDSQPFAITVLSGGGSTVTGVARDAATGAPLAGALVTLQATTTQATTDATGQFALDIANGADRVIVAAKKGYYNAAVTTSTPATGLDLALQPVNVGNNANYTFVSPDTCAQCHPRQMADWEGSVMATSGVNAWVHDVYSGTATPGGSGGFVYVRDSAFRNHNPNAECASCHQPERWIPAGFSGRLEGPADPGFPSTPAAHGVSCETCHKIADVDTSKLNFPGIYPGKITFNRPEAGTQVQYGLLPDASYHQQGTMQPSYQPQLAAEVCAACHEDKSDLDEDGAFDDLVSEPTYGEWKASPYGDPQSPSFKTCIDCHMPSSGHNQISPLGPIRDPQQVRTHRIEGTTPAYLENAVELGLQTQVTGSELKVDVAIANTQAGHSVPTGVPVRNLVLLVEAWREGDDPLLQSLTFTGTQTVHALGGVGNPAQGYFAGRPGKLYAKAQVDANGALAFFTDARAVAFDTRIPALGTDTTSYTFALPAGTGTIKVRAKLIYRRAFREFIDAKGWTTTGKGKPLADITAPEFGHVMEAATRDVAFSVQDVTPPTVPSGLTATTTSASEVRLAWNAATDTGVGVAGYRVYRNGGTTPLATVTGTAYTDAGLAAATPYTYTVSALDAASPANESAQSAPASATTQGAPAYQARDIGAVAAAGSYTVYGGIHTVQGSGADIWSTADEFQFAWQALAGNGQITARLVSQTDTHPWAKAGLMLRETLNANSRHASLFIAPGYGSAFQYRTSTGGITGPSGGTNAAHMTPYWLRLVRNGNVIRGFTSPDGSTWTQRGTITLSNLAANVYVGLAITSHADGVLSTAVFDNVSPSGPAADTTAPTVPSGLVAAAAGSSQVNLSWLAAADAGSGVAGYRIYRDGGSVPVATVAGTTYSDSGLAANTVYSYSVSAFDGATPANESARSGVAFATTAALPNQPPVASFSASTLTGTAPLTVRFDGSASTDADGSIIGHAWDFGDRSSGAGALVEHTYATPGVYLVTLTVTDDDAATDLANPVTITVSAATDVTPPTVPGGLTAAAAGTDRISLSWSAATDSGSGVAGYRVYRNGGAIPVATVTTTSYLDTGLTANTLYSYTVSAFDATTPANESIVSVATGATTLAAATFQSQDIGAVAASGSFSDNGGVIAIGASGADIWGTADEFRFAWQALSGNGQLTARLVSQDNTDVWAKAGLMVRETLAANARHASVFISPVNGSVFQYRRTTGGTSAPSAPGNSMQMAPHWLRVIRAGNVVTGFTSTDGLAWTQRGTVTLSALSATVYIGLAATSHSDGNVSVAVFDNVSR